MRSFAASLMFVQYGAGKSNLPDIICSNSRPSRTRVSDCSRPERRTHVLAIIEERREAAEEDVHDDAYTPEVHLRPVALAHQHLGRHVDWRAAGGLEDGVLIADNFRETKVA